MVRAGEALDLLLAIAVPALTAPAGIAVMRLRLSAKP
jgi:hypothetical protein